MKVFVDMGCCMYCCGLDWLFLLRWTKEKLELELLLDLLMGMYLQY